MSPNPAPTPPPTIWTIKALLNWTTEFLAKKEIENPRADAQILLAHVLKCKKIDLIVRYNEQPEEAERTRFRELIQRRVAGWPVAYLVGSRDFYLLSFDVSPDVLIPRPETETLVLEALAFLKPLKSPSVLDIGTGSGCIAISIAHQKNDAQITAIDISPDALNMAQRNATKHGIAERIMFLQGDLFAPLPSGVAFDLVASNPPYIAHSEFAQLAPDVRDHEPRVALDGGLDGLDFYRRIAGGVGRFLKVGGRLLVEIGYSQEAAVRGILAEQAELELGPTLKDMGGHSRVVSAKRI
ncbi:MAG TPA: peptide chain release factor N(5)-glutamine methyltransferase [Gemmata sp.]|jgi:release factor glutamine methyltransferase|nr:peptide chain release factor N(5)-glutamine methyltransferase [Gemmata sp.]